MKRLATLGMLAATLGAGMGLGFCVGRIRPPLLHAQTREPGAGQRSQAQVEPGSDEALYQELDRQYEKLRVLDETFALAARAVAPSVVHIVARKDGTRENGIPARFEETGSGAIVRADADSGQGRFVLTNFHVVAGANPEDVTIQLHDGRLLKPQKIWADKKADIAVLKLDQSKLPAARLGNSDDSQIGTWVLAVGSPFGLTHSVSQGIISARGRFEDELFDQDGVENQDFLQTDAAINPGNSGGPLVNLRGEVIGINTAIASNGGGSEGVGFSIPINLARWALNQLVSQGRVSRGAIGVKLQDVTPSLSLELGLERPRGARVQWVQPGTPAEKAGLKPGDIILKFDGASVSDFNHLINIVSMRPIGSTARLDLWRERKSLSAEVTIADRDEIVSAQESTPPRADRGGLLRRPRERQEDIADGPGLDAGEAWGLLLAPVDGPAAARRHALPDSTRGVVVERVEKNGPLASILLPHDVIQAINGRPVASADDVRSALKAKGEHAIQFQRVENGMAQKRIVQVELP